MPDQHPHQAASDEAEPDEQSTPGGVARDIEEKADELGATTDVDEAEAIERRPSADDGAR
jgi:hypothetical protein